MRRNRTDLLQIRAEDRHLEIVGAFRVLVVDEQHADELLADIDLGGVVLLRPRHHADARVAEQPLQIGLDLADFLSFHGALPRLRQGSMAWSGDSRNVGNSRAPDKRAKRAPIRGPGVTSRSDNIGAATRRSFALGPGSARRYAALGRDKREGFKSPRRRTS